MGGVAALTALGAALALCVVPALAAQLSSQRSGLGVLPAVLLGVDAFVLGHGGSLVLSGGVVQGGLRLMPLGLTLVLVLLSAAVLRRMGRALALVDVGGALRVGALRDAGSALLAFVLVYAAGGGVLSSLARSDHVRTVGTSAVVGCGLVALVGGGAGLAWSLRRRGAPGVPAVRILELLPAPYDAAARGAVIALLGLAAGAMLTVVGALALGFSRAGALMDQLAPGWAGGAVLLLVQVALLPTLALWVLALLLGGHFAVGVGTSVSLGASRTGLLPALPLLAVLPEPGRAPWYSWLLLAVPLAALTLGACRVVLDLRGRAARERYVGYGAWAASVVVGTSILLAMSAGSIGTGRLRLLGPAVPSAALGLIGLTAAALVLAILLLESPWGRRGRPARAPGSLPDRAESAPREPTAAGDPGGGGDEDAGGEDEDDGDDDPTPGDDEPGPGPGVRTPAGS